MRSVIDKRASGGGRGGVRALPDLQGEGVEGSASPPATGATGGLLRGGGGGAFLEGVPPVPASGSHGGRLAENNLPSRARVPCLDRVALPVGDGRHAGRQWCGGRGLPGGRPGGPCLSGG